MMYICILCFLVYGWPLVASECQLGWIQFGNKCYFFSSDSRTWVAASSVCRAHSAELVIIDTEQENAFIAAEISKLTGEFWLDGTDQFLEGKWEWASTAQPFSYSNWYPGEPNDRNGEDCLITNDFHNSYWTDVACTRLQTYICERR
ncbi:perlucin-like protein [Mytilus trossulus]|uniref:perlucin-like protein n=1 Tax=Mytilus trossulus TaxID=6551 RepID=UPI003007E815